MKNLFKNKIIKTVVIIQGVMVLVYPILFVLKFQTIPSQVPLLYSLPRGNEQLVPVFFLYFFPIFHLIILGLHLLGINRLMNKYMVASYVLLFISLSALILLTLTFIKVLLLIS